MDYGIETTTKICFIYHSDSFRIDPPPPPLLNSSSQCWAPDVGQTQESKIRTTKPSLTIELVVQCYVML